MIIFSSDSYYTQQGFLGFIFASNTFRYIYFGLWAIDPEENWPPFMVKIRVGGQ